MVGAFETSVGVLEPVLYRREGADDPPASNLLPL